MAKDLTNKETMDILVPQDELLAMYKDDAGVGAEEMGGQSPLLKVYSQGKSRNMELVDGKKPNHGWFFYTPTQEQFEVAEINILKISRGFRTKGMEGDKDKFNQVMAGILRNEGKNAPFIMYLTGLKLSPMWDFGKEISRYTSKMPMFALNVNMFCKDVEHDYGSSPVPQYELNKKNPFITDPGEYQFLKDSYNDAERILRNIVSSGLDLEAEVVDEPPFPTEA